jgi:hypothetical protein
MHALVVIYGLSHSSSAQHDELCEEIAPAVAAVRGLLSKTWLANRATGRYGGFYVFETKGHFDRFVASELFETLRSHHSITGLTTSDFSINGGPTAVTRGPAQAIASART